MLKKTLTVLVGCAGLIVAGCGDDDDGEADTTNEPAAGGETEDTDESDDTAETEGSEPATDGPPEETDDTTAVTGESEDDATEPTDEPDDEVSGDAAGADAYVDATVEELKSAEPGELQFTDEQAECVAPKWIEILDPGRLHDAGIEPGTIGDTGSFGELDLSQDDGYALYDAFGECGVDPRQATLDAFTADDAAGVDAEQSTCLRDAFDDDLVREFTVAVFVGGDDWVSENQDLAAQLNDIYVDCGLIEEPAGG